MRFGEKGVFTSNCSKYERWFQMKYKNGVDGKLTGARGAYISDLGTERFGLHSFDIYFPSAKTGFYIFMQQFHSNSHVKAMIKMRELNQQILLITRFIKENRCLE